MDKKVLMDFAIIGAVGGAIAALCLRPFTTLPVLAIGGIIGAGAFAAFAAVFAMMIYLEDKDPRKKDQESLLFLPLFAACVNSIAIGVCLAAAANDISSEIFAKWYTAIVAGAVIGAIGLAVGFLVVDFFLEKPDQSLGPNHIVESINVTAEGANATLESPEPRSVGGP